MQVWTDEFPSKPCCVDSRAAKAWKPMRLDPLVQFIAFILTAACNLKCRYCYQNRHSPGRLSLDELETALSWGIHSAAGKLEILFLGGEPLLEFPLIRQAVEYVEAHQPPDKQVVFRISTNGTLLTDEILKFLERHSFEIQLSFDGLAAAQDLRAPGTFPILDGWLDRWRKDYPDFLRQHLTVSILVVPQNLAYLPDSIRYLVSKGVGNISVAPGITCDSDWRIGSIEELDAVLGQVCEFSLRHRERAGEIPVLLFRDTREDPSDQPQELPMCGILNGHILTVDVDSQAYGCAAFAGSCQEFTTPLQKAAHEAVRIGSIHDPDFEERLAAFQEKARRTGLFDRKEDKYSAYGRCRECEFIDQCTICPASTIHRPGNEDPNRVSDFCCAFNRVALKYRTRFPKQPSLRELIQGTPEMKMEMKRWQALAEAARAARAT